MAIVPRAKGEEDKIMSGLHKLSDEDPVFRVRMNAETRQMVISGLGEQEISVLRSKLKSKFNVDSTIEAPRVPYREAIRKKVKVQGKHKKQSGGSGQYGVVQMRFEPAPDGVEYEFVNAIVGGVVPREFIPAVEKGLKEALIRGVLAGYPMVGIKATLYDGKYHPVDSK